VRFRAPASILLRRAQLILLLAAVIPTALATATGIVLLAVGRSPSAIVIALLILSFCVSSLTGYILGSIFVGRGASLTRVQTDFLSSVSHELRTPLTSMRVFLDTILGGRVTDPEEQRRYLGVVSQELERLDRLVGRLLELSKLESGRRVYERKPVSVDDVVDDALSALQAATLGGAVKLERQTTAGLWVKGDRSALAQALGNLLTNAWKYGRAEGKVITLISRPHGKHVEIAVCDNGPGVRPDEMKRIFDHFERGRAALEARQPGSGLGLAIVRAVMREHRGRVVVHNQPGGGARFSLLIPRGAEEPR
jgi:two-component system phosphate regulon sensor histidine kinase PhoR